MKIVKLNLHHLPHLQDHYATALGFFDGVHLGHQRLIKETLRVAREKELIPSVMTFDQHPLSVLKGEQREQLTSLEDRAEIFAQEGIETLFVLEFNKEVAALDPDIFIKKYILSLHIDHVVIGEDFRFGDHNRGDKETLTAYDFGLSIMPPVMYDDQRKVSSSLIRELLAKGNVGEAFRLLSRPYRVTGQVVHGKARGRTIGFPTANVDMGDYCLVKGGVYGVILETRGQGYQGMANVGTNPTFDDIKKMTLEVHIFDFDEDIYGQEAKVSFIFFMRPEVKFKDINALAFELKYDKEYIQNWFLREGGKRDGH